MFIINTIREYPCLIILIIIFILSVIDPDVDNQDSNVYKWFNKGLEFLALEKYEEAIKCYDKALEIDPNTFFAPESSEVISLDIILSH